jgi:hypothetical protein
VRRLVQARERGIEAAFRPQRVDDAVAVHPSTWCQRKKLHQGRGLPAVPPVVRKRQAVDADVEAAQESYLDRHRLMLLPCRTQPAGAVQADMVIV